MRISDWSSDVCSSDLPPSGTGRHKPPAGLARYDRRLQGEPMADTADITALLDAARDGDRGALDRVPATLYQELPSMARRQIAGQHGQTLGCTATAHAATFKLTARRGAEIDNRRPFFPK